MVQEEICQFYDMRSGNSPKKGIEFQYVLIVDQVQSHAIHATFLGNSATNLATSEPAVKYSSRWPHSAGRLHTLHNSRKHHSNDLFA